VCLKKAYRRRSGGKSLLFFVSCVQQTVLLPLAPFLIDHAHLNLNWLIGQKEIIAEFDNQLDPSSRYKR